MTLTTHPNLAPVKEKVEQYLYFPTGASSPVAGCRSKQLVVSISKVIFRGPNAAFINSEQRRCFVLTEHNCHHERHARFHPSTVDMTAVRMCTAAHRHIINDRKRTHTKQKKIHSRAVPQVHEHELQNGMNGKRKGRDITTSDS